MQHTTDFVVQPGGALTGRVRVPGDKSISHRSIMLGALAEGVTRVSGFLEGADSLATLRAFRAMGVEIEGPEQGRVTIHGVGMHGLRRPDAPLDLGNSRAAVHQDGGHFGMGHPQGLDGVLDAGMAVEPVGPGALAPMAGEEVAKPAEKTEAGAILVFSGHSG